MNFKNRSEKYLKFCAYLAVVVLTNLVGINLFFRMDLTENRTYSISEASRKVVSTLSEPLTIDVFFTRNLPAPHNNTERYLRDLLAEYSIYANNYFNFRFFDVSAEEGDISEDAKQNQDLARNYGIHPVQIQIVEKDEVKFRRAYMGLVIIHGDIIERIPTITSTDGLEYQLTTAIQKVNNKVSALLGLPENIQIRLFLSSSLESVAPFIGLSDLAELPKKIRIIVEELNEQTYGKLTFEYLDPTQDQGLEAVLKEYNLLNLKWPALSGGAIQAGKGAIGLVLEYGDKVVTIPLISVVRVPLMGTRYTMVDLSKLGEIISENLESLIDINEDLGYLADHGTLKLAGTTPAELSGRQTQNTASNFQTLVSKSYTIRDVDLKGSSLPDSLNCLVIAGPTERFTDYELFQIDQFLMQGKNLAIFLDTFREVMPPNQQAMSFNQGPTYVSLSTGLEELLEHYGIRIKKSYVMDEHCFRQRVPTRFGGGERAIYFAPVIKNQLINKDLEFMKNIKGLVTMKISPLELNEERPRSDSLQIYKLFSSSEKSWEMSGRINLNPLFIRPPGSADEMRSLPLAYVLEGEFSSYFAGKPIPEQQPLEGEVEEKDVEKQDDKRTDGDLAKIEGQGAFLSRSKPGRIFLISSSEMIKDNMLDPAGRSPNATFVLNLLDYLNNREDIAVMRSKKQRFNPLDDSEAKTRALVKSFNIVGLPILVNLFGLLVWFLRHARKKRIQLMFQN